MSSYLLFAVLISFIFVYVLEAISTKSKCIYGKKSIVLISYFCIVGF